MCSTRVQVCTFSWMSHFFVRCWLADIQLSKHCLTTCRGSVLPQDIFSCEIVIKTTAATIFIKYSLCLIESKSTENHLRLVFFLWIVHYLVQIQWGGQTGRPLAASSSGSGQSSHQNTPWPWRRYPSTPAEPHELAGGLEWSSRSAARGISHLSPDKMQQHMISMLQISKQKTDMTEKKNVTLVVWFNTTDNLNGPCLWLSQTSLVRSQRAEWVQNATYLSKHTEFNINFWDMVNSVSAEKASMLTEYCNKEQLFLHWLKTRV